MANEFRAITKKLFFDAKAVLKGVDRGTRAALSRFGAYVRTRARSSIRKRKGVSAPGRPPSSHVGTLRGLIYFGYDAARKSVAIGPVRFQGRADAELLEQDHKPGGTMGVTRRKDGKTVRMVYRARPFMGPAFEAEKPNLPRLWAGAVK